MTKISIIIPCYNQASFILETLASIEKQTFKDWQCLIVNDGSTDHSLQILEAFVQDKPKFEIINKSNGGVSSARNEGVKQAQGEYLVFLDGDDFVSENYLEETYKAIQSSQSPKLVYTQIFFFDEKEGEWELPVYNYKELLVDSMLYSTFLFRKSDFEQTQGFDEQMRRGLEDWEFLIRFLSPNDKVVKINTASCFYRIRNVSRNNSLNREEMQILKNHIYRKNIDIYVNHLGDFLELYKTNRNLQRQIDIIQNSKAYKLSKKITNVIIKLTGKKKKTHK